MAWYDKAGADPERSWRFFIAGLVIFVPGAMLTVLGTEPPHTWWWPGIALLAVGFSLALWGYVGIFANRLARAFNPPSVSKNDRLK